jgi:hypothetical protein
LVEVEDLQLPRGWGGVRVGDVVGDVVVVSEPWMIAR